MEVALLIPLILHTVIRRKFVWQPYGYTVDFNRLLELSEKSSPMVLLNILKY